MLICRSEKRLQKDIREKIALFCNVDSKAVISAYDVPSIYEVPLVLHREKMDTLVTSRLHMPEKKIKLDEWNHFVEGIRSPIKEVEIAVCGKYITHLDAYKSIMEAFTHAGAENQAKVKIRPVNAEELEDGDLKSMLDGISGILVPGGFGERGIEGKIKAVKYARENDIPFFGICLGLQCAVVEFARNVCGLRYANSSEFKKTKYSVIDLMPDQKDVKNMGATMRLGAYPCSIEENTMAIKAYKKNYISERHRHRYEFNNEYKALLVEKGLVVSGSSPTGDLVEIIEIKDHPWYLGCQFHPEFKSRPMDAHPLFRDFIKAALEFSKAKAG